MRKLLFSLPCIIATSFALNAVELDDVSAKHHHSSSHHHHHDAESITTTFTLTPVSNTGFTLAVVPVSNRGLSIAADGTITFPNTRHWLVSYNIDFSPDSALRNDQFQDIWQAIGAFEFSDSTSGAFAGTIVNFNGTTVVNTSALSSTIVTQVLYDNTFDPIATLTPLSGTVTIHRLDESKGRCGH